MVVSLALPLLSGLLVSLAATRACEALARRWGVIVPPRADRWHRQPVPLLGGVAIMLGLAAALPFVPGAVSRFGPFLLLSLAMGAAGLVDDLWWPLRPQVKLVIQIVLAGILIQLGSRLPLTGSAVLNVGLTLFWVVGITNAFNLLDNMDGLAAGMAALTAAFRLAFFWMDGDPAGAGLMAAAAGAAVGFLVRNFPPARIFMGDAGSLFLGFFLSGASLVGESAYSRGVAAVLVFPVLLVLIPIFDTTFVTLTRLLTGRPVSQGGRDHTSHRLVALGVSERRALGFLFATSALSGLLAILSYRYGFTYTVVLLALLLLGLVLLGVHLARVQVLREGAARPETAVVRVVADVPFKRQAATVAIDLVLIVVAYYAAYLLRFEGGIEAHRDVLLGTLGPVLVIELSALALSGVYRGVWRYTSIPELLRLLRGVTAGVGAVTLYLLFATGFQGLSRAVFVLDWMLLVLLLSGTRLSFRLLAELLSPARPGFRRVLIYGAGDGGELTLRELRNNAALGRQPVGFLDDDRSKVGRRIHDVPVLGGIDLVEALLVQHEVGEVIVASHKIRPERVRRLEAICAARGVQVRRAFLRIE